MEENNRHQTKFHQDNQPKASWLRRSLKSNAEETAPSPPDFVAYHDQKGAAKR
jgi:hypothetical protein